MSAAQESRIYDFLAEQCRRRAPFNRWGALLVYIRPIDRGDGSWFCSQLVVAAFQEAGFFGDVEPCAMGPAEVKRYLEVGAANGSFPCVAETLNPRLIKRLDIDHERVFD